MLYGKLPNIDKPVSRLVQGTTVLDEREVERSYELLDGAVELGCRTFDTAHVYGQGMQERLFGRWYPNYGPGQAQAARQVDYIQGACMLARRAEVLDGVARVVREAGV